MSGKKDIRVTEESSTGRNQSFKAPGHAEMSRAQLVSEIRAGEFAGYHIRVINGVATPVSNPDRSEGNNLG